MVVVVVVDEGHLEVDRKKVADGSNYGFHQQLSAHFIEVDTVSKVSPFPVRAIEEEGGGAVMHPRNVIPKARQVRINLGEEGPKGDEIVPTGHKA